MPTGRCDKRPPVIAGPRYFVDIRSDDRTSMNSSVGRMNSGRSRLHGFDGTEAEPGSRSEMQSIDPAFGGTLFARRTLFYRGTLFVSNGRSIEASRTNGAAAALDRPCQGSPHPPLAR